MKTYTFNTSYTEVFNCNVKNYITSSLLNKNKKLLKIFWFKELDTQKDLWSSSCIPNFNQN